jgi:glycosyltransferase involved in cell wall biosynthesis
MKLTYITTYDAKNIKAWSGTGFYISKALMNQSIQLESLGGLKTKYFWFHEAKRRYYKYFLQEEYLMNRHIEVTKGYAKEILRRMPGNTDIIFSPSSIPVAQLETDKPIAFYTDATFASIHGYYPDTRDYCNETIRDGHLMERSALDRCQLGIYASDWAARSAINKYDADPNKIKIVPFGANIEATRTILDIKRIINQRSRSRCKILFIGTDWYRKGGDTVFEVVKQLNEDGLDTELTIVGCKPTSSYSMPSYVKIHKFIDKASSDGRAKLNGLLENSHFLFVPSIAEAFGIVYCEANSFGVPALATNTGGIPTVIEDGINGMKFELNANPLEYTDYILNLFSNYSQYKELALSSFNEYQKRLNWTVSGAKIKSFLQELL